MTTLTREQWLDRLVDEVRPMLKAAGGPVPAKVRITCGWPSKYATSSTRRRIGECWKATESAGKYAEVFISPLLSDPVEVAAVVVHELIHASKPEAAHGAGFRRVAVAIGLEGKMTATVPGKALRAKLSAIVAEMPKYRHDTLRLISADKKQTTRLLKVECLACGYVVRTTAKWIEMGCPTCPCGSLMELVTKEESE